MPAPADPQTDPMGLSLALAMVVSSAAPLLLLDEALRVVAVSVSFCDAFDIECATMPGRVLFDLGGGEWGSPKLRSLLNTTASGDAQVADYEMDLNRPGLPTRCLMLNAKRLAYGDKAAIRILLAISDVTDVRATAREEWRRRREDELRTDQLVHDNELLMQETRHRIANSLQIIASVMMQNARRTQSDETRSHLRDAHHRVMSVAELQQQLAVSMQGEVNIREYLTKLCATISASMIGDPKTLSLLVDADDVEIDAGISVSLGLIVTELVINALKHAFPDDTAGKICVDFHGDGGDWTLCVRDTGVGMPVGGPAQAGLGTSIVQALARQLRAQVDVAPAYPGARISIVHTEAAVKPVAPSRVELSRAELAV